jgi:hypothetical protein
VERQRGEVHSAKNIVHLVGEIIGETAAKKGGDIGLPSIQAQVDPLIGSEQILLIDQGGARPVRRISSSPIPIGPFQINGNSPGDISGINEDRDNLLIFVGGCGRNVGAESIGDILANDGERHVLCGRLSLDLPGAASEAKSQNQKKTSHFLHIQDGQHPVWHESGRFPRKVKLAQRPTFKALTKTVQNREEYV